MKAIIAFLIWLTIITYASLAPISIELSDMPDNFDKLMHVLFYLVTAFLLGFIIKSSHQRLQKSLLFCFFWGTMIEILQNEMNTGRHFEYFDIIANIIGALIGAIMFNIVRKLIPYG